jgi:hypothetical protein
MEMPAISTGDASICFSHRMKFDGAWEGRQSDKLRECDVSLLRSPG